MQIVSHNTPNIHPVMDDIETLYAITSERKTNNSIVPLQLDNSFFDLVGLFFRYGNIVYNVNYKKYKYSLINIPKNPRNIIVCASGGKDSTATILKYKEFGYNVYIYHLKGINLTYKDEYESVQAIAEKLNLPLILDEIKLSGKQEWIEHPMKNMIIANRALTYGIREGITAKIAFGNFRSSSLYDEPFDVCGGDCIEMWKSYEKIVRNFIPKFKIGVILENFEDTLEKIAEYPDLLPDIQSCIGPYRYRDHLRKVNSEKYQVEIPKRRCGSCWKCCLEYCVFCDKGIYQYNEAYYSHCIDTLRKTLSKEYGYKVTLNETWQHYFFYEITESRWNNEEIATG